MVIARERGGRMGSNYLMAIAFQFCKRKRILEIDGGNLYKIMNALHTIELYT